MATFKTSDVISGSVVEVFAVMSDMAGHVEWDPQTLRVEQLTEGPVGEGTRFEMMVKGPGKLSLEVTDFDEPKRITFHASMKMGEGRHTFNLSPVDGGTKVDQVLENGPDTGQRNGNSFCTTHEYDGEKIAKDDHRRNVRPYPQPSRLVSVRSRLGPRTSNA